MEVNAHKSVCENPKEKIEMHASTKIDVLEITFKAYFDLRYNFN